MGFTVGLLSRLSLGYSSPPILLRVLPSKVLSISEPLRCSVVPGLLSFFLAAFVTVLSDLFRTLLSLFAGLVWFLGSHWDSSLLDALKSLSGLTCRLKSLSQSLSHSVLFKGALSEKSFSRGL